MGCGLYPFQVKAICIGGAIFVVFVHLTSAESHKERTSFLCKQGKEALPEPTHMEPGSFQFAISMFEGEMEVVTSAACYVSEPCDAPSWAGGSLPWMRRMAYRRVSSGSEHWPCVRWRIFESSNCPSVSLR